MTRFELLHKGPIRKPKMELDLLSLYKFTEFLSIDHIPNMRSESHTMFQALDTYVSQKLPTFQLKEVSKNNGTIEVHGIYPKHFEYVYGEELSRGDLIEINFYHRPTTRKYNVVRPRFFITSNHTKLLVVIVPGSDYIKHYGTIIRHYLQINNFTADLKLFYYPTAFHTLPMWTHLEEGFVYKNDLVIIGYVDEVYSNINEQLGLLPISNASNPYLESRRFKTLNNKKICFLGVNFSFWGNLSKPIVESICNSNATEIIYAGKLGSMTSEESLYRDLFSPTNYFTLDHQNIINKTFNLKNGLTEMFPYLDTGTHVSVPTVLEEDYLQREVSKQLNATSIDNEISQMAASIHKYNIINNKNVKFSAFHFATDYVRTFEERYMNTSHDLATNREISAISKKDLAIKKCAQYLIEYLKEL